jgi:hypothetical protein
VLALDNFGTNAGGWTSQDQFPRTVGDVNGDGRADIVGFGIAGTYTALGQTDVSFTELTLAVDNFGTLAGGWTSQNQFPRVLDDVNGDGRTDIVGFGVAGTYTSLGQTDGSFAAPVLAVDNFGTGAGGWATQDQFTRTVGDVNGDGRTDIVGFGVAGTYTALGQADGSFADPVLALDDFGTVAGGWTSQNQFTRTVGDVNGDGRADIVGFGVAGAYTALGQADGSFADPILAVDNFGTVAGGWTSQDLFPRTVGDVNGDGRDDIVGFGIFGTYTSLGQVDGTFADPILALDNFGTSAGGWATQDQFPRVLGDVSGDGRADIVGFGVAGVYTALGRADGTFDQAVFKLGNFGNSGAAGGWTSDNTFPRYAADVTGDHLADIVGFGAFGVYVAQAQLV